MKLVADITYLPTANGFIYLSAIQDLCNNEIISHSFSAKNDLALVFATLNRTPAMPDALLDGVAERAINGPERSPLALAGRFRLYLIRAGSFMLPTLFHKVNI